jgi:hypothetical protein
MLTDPLLGPLRQHFGGSRFHNIWGTGEVHAGFYWGNLREEDHLDDSGTDRRKILKWIFERLDWRRIGTGGTLL